MNGDLLTPSDNASICIRVELLPLASEQETNGNCIIHFNKILDTLRRLDQVLVSDNPCRFVHTKFITSTRRHHAKTCLDELQCHRKVFGFVGIVLTRQQPNARWIEYFRHCCQPYETTLVDSRLLLFCDSSPMMETNGKDDGPEAILRYSSFNCLDRMEEDLKQFIKGLFWVLESRRLDVSYEKLRNPVYPTIDILESSSTAAEIGKRRNVRRLAVGRRRKHTADYTLLTGLPLQALDAYKAAIDFLKSSSDYLWLAAAHEGYACAAFEVRYPRLSLNQPTLNRANTFCEGVFKEANQSQLTVKRVLSISGNCDIETVTAEEILDHFVQALQHYQEFAVAIKMEIDCVFKTAHLLLMLRDALNLDKFLTAACCKFLSDEFKRISDAEKARICTCMAEVYERCSFGRKAAFYLRFAALFTISNADNGRNAVDAHRQAHALLIKAVKNYTKSYGINNRGSFGWPAVQVNTLHELHVAAVRAGLKEAAIRHLAFLLEHFHQSLSSLQLAQYCSELLLLTKSKATSVDRPLQVDHGAVLPPLSFHSLPTVLSIKFKSPPGDCRALDEKEKSSIFIYSPFDKTRAAKDYVIAKVPTILEVTFFNPLPLIIEAHDFTIRMEGVEFEVESICAKIPAQATLVQQIRGVALEAGWLKVIGYAMEVFGVRSSCRLESISRLNMEPVEVLPAMPLSDLRFLGQGDIEIGTQATVYSGQTITVTVELKNQSADDDIRDIILCLEKPPFRAREIPVTVQLDSDDRIERMAPGECLRLNLRISCENDSPQWSSSDALEDAIYNTFLSVQYTATAGSREFKRNIVNQFDLNIKQVINLRHWSLIAGKDWLNRYLVLDLQNVTNEDVHINMDSDRAALIPPGDSLRLPLLIGCYPWPCGGLALVDPSMTEQDVRDMLYREIRLHVNRETTLKWRTAGGQKGNLSLSRLLQNTSLCRDLCVPPLGIEMRVPSAESSSRKHEFITEIGNPLGFEFCFTSLEEAVGSTKVSLTVDFYIDQQNGQTIDANEDVLFLGPEKHTLTLNSAAPFDRRKFVFLFCCSGEFKAKFRCRCTNDSLGPGRDFHYDEFTLSELSFCVN